MLATHLMNFATVTYGEIGLILFVLIFLAATVWALTRKSTDISHWSEIPLDSETSLNNRK